MQSSLRFLEFMVTFFSRQDSAIVGEDQFDWNEQFSAVAKQVLQWNSVQTPTETHSKRLLFLKKTTTFANQCVEVQLYVCCIF